jgi:tetratricopeptide (TPR) repeat protein
MKRLNTLIVFLLVGLLPCLAQRLVGEAPSQVAVGEQFRLTYTIGTQNVKGFKAGNIPDALEVLMGPSESRQSSFQMVNGHTSTSSSITYTFILCANKSGTFTIPSAHIVVGDKTIASNAIKVHASGSARSGSNGGGRQNNDQPMRAAGSNISSSDLFIKVSANKRRVHEQEPILLTYKVYTLVDLTQLNGKMPDLKGFHTQEIQLPQQKSFKVENYNGRPYRTVTWSQYVMFPQLTGKLEIPSITFEGIVVQQNRDIDPFEAFFNGGSGYVEVKKKIKAPGLTIQVDPLPTRPAGFSGGVGQFRISAQLDKSTVKANDPVNLRVVVSGRGNLKLIKEPTVNFPKDFDKYSAKVTDKTKLTSNGVEGNMIYDIMAVPRHPGKYEIPPIDFTYYDTGSNVYKTIHTQSITLDVEKGSGKSTVSDYTGQTEVEQLAKDIRYIKLGDVSVNHSGGIFFGSLAYWIWMVGLLVVFVSLFVVFRRRAIDNADLVKQRGKKANRVATKRLRKAAKLMVAGQSAAFYDEVLRALWGYVGDKLNIPVESLSRENIEQCLSDRGVDKVIIDRFIAALDECEYERYAPGDIKGNMNKTFDAAMNAITDIEDKMRHSKHTVKGGSATLAIVLLFALASFSSGALAITKANADSAYAHEEYTQAIKDYEELLGGGKSAVLYYNLGNAYYRSGNVTRAILNYERALLLSPADNDIRYNLQFARTKTIDKITPETEMFFVSWYHAIVNLASVDGWGHVALCSLALAIVLALLYLFSWRVWLRKVGFFGGLAMLMLFVLSNLFAFQQRYFLENRNGAIVISPSVTVKSTPSKGGTELFILHEGTRIDITDGSMRGWKKVRLADGREGWMETSSMEVI